MLTAILLFVGLVGAIAPSVGDELDDVGSSAKEGFDDVVEYLAESPLRLSKAEVDNYIDQAGEQISANREKITAGVVSGAAKAVEFVTEFFLTLVLIFFFIKDGPDMFRWFESQFPSRNRRHVRAVGERAWAAIGAYLRGTAIIALVDAILIAVTLIVVGVPLVAPLAVLTFFGAFFPLIGAVAAGVVAALVALVTNGPFDALIVAGAILVIQQVEGDVLQPIVMGKAVRLHPVAILLALTAGAILAGVVGAFLAVPVAAVGASVGNYIKKVSREERGLATGAAITKP
jgi:predicted PurR-regulated permease PerM